MTATDIDRRNTKIPAKNDNRIVVTWALAAGVASCLNNLAEWSDMYARQSTVLERVLAAAVRTHNNA